MSNATIVERLTALEQPTTRDDFADEPTVAPAETDPEPTSKSMADHRHHTQPPEPARGRRDRRALRR